MADYINPLTGNPLDEAKLQEIVKQYGSYDNWISVLRKGAATRGMLNTDPKANGGNAEAKRIMKEQAQARTGAGEKVMDLVADATHYIPSTAIAADIVDMAKGGGGENLASVAGQAGSKAIPAEVWAGAAEEMPQIASGLKGAMGAITGIGKVSGMIDDVKSTAKLVKDVVTTPNKDYESRYFKDAGNPVQKEPKTWGEWLRK